MAPRKRSQASPAIENIDESMSKDLTKYVTVLQAAEMMGVGRIQASYLVRNKKLQGIKMGHGWLVYIPSIQKYLETKSKRGRSSYRASQTQKAKVTGPG